MNRTAPARGALAALAAAAALPLVATATEVEGGGGWNPLQGDFGNFFWTVVVLLLVFWVLSKYAWGPVLAGLQGREDYIRTSLEQAKGERERAQVLLAEYEAKLAAARAEIDGMIEEARRDAVVLRDREEAAARDEGRAILDRARREIELARDTAVAELYQRAAALATDAAGRILEREIGPADHERLIADAIAAVENMRGGRQTRLERQIDADIAAIDPISGDRQAGN